MKKSILILSALFAFCHGNAQVTVYSNCDYNQGVKGISYTFNKPGLFVLNEEIGLYHKVSSIKIDQGYKVTLTQEKELGGKTLILTGDVPCLVKYKFNDIAYAILIESDPANVPLTAEAIHAGQAFTTLYAENAYVAQYAGKIDGYVFKSTGNNNPAFGSGYFSKGTKNGAVYYNNLKQGADNRTAIWGDIISKYATHDFEHGDMGWPVTSQAPTPKKTGEFAHFQNGSIYSSPAKGSHVVWGTVRDKWAKLGWENSELGFPKTDEVDIVEPATASTTRKVGVYQEFEYGRIYYQWSGASQAFEMHGDILAKYLSFGGPTKIGFPISDEQDMPGGKKSLLPSITIVFKSGVGAHLVYNTLYAVWMKNGGSTGKLGFPTNDPGYAGNVETQEFEGGVISGTQVKYKN